MGDDGSPHPSPLPHYSKSYTNLSPHKREMHREGMLSSRVVLLLHVNLKSVHLLGTKGSSNTSDRNRDVWFCDIGRVDAVLITPGCLLSEVSSPSQLALCGPSGAAADSFQVHRHTV